MAGKFRSRQAGLRVRRGIRHAGMYFPSKGEFSRYCQLELYQRAGLIDGLVHQPAYPMWVTPQDGSEAIMIGIWKADFSYTHKCHEERTIEDFKGYAKADRLGAFKRRVVEAFYGLTIHVVTRPKEQPHVPG